MNLFLMNRKFQGDKDSTHNLWRLIWNAFFICNFPFDWINFYMKPPLVYGYRNVLVMYMYINQKIVSLDVSYSYGCNTCRFL